jgi:hypothetical protein
MKIADVSIRRPVFAFMMSAAILVLGIASYNQLGLDLMPKTDMPVVFVQTSLPGASAEEIETQITKPIEEVVNTIAGIDELRSTSQQGASRVIITFVLERDIESAVQDVRDKIATIVNRFPLDTLPSTIQKIDPDSSPILTVAVSGQRSQKEISEIVDKQIKQVLETVNNVGEVFVHYIIYNVAKLGGVENAGFLCYIAAILKGRDCLGKGAGAADSKLLHRAHHRALGIARRRLGEVLGGEVLLRGKFFAFLEGGNGNILFGILVFAVNGQISVKV